MGISCRVVAFSFLTPCDADTQTDADAAADADALAAELATVRRARIRVLIRRIANLCSPCRIQRDRASPLA
jgi:hypothetical protein